MPKRKEKINEDSNFKDLFSLWHNVTTSKAIYYVICIQHNSFTKLKLKDYTNYQLNWRPGYIRFDEDVTTDVSHNATRATLNNNKAW